MTGPTPPDWSQRPDQGQPGGYGQQQYGAGQQPQYGPGQPYQQQPMGPVTSQFARLDPGPSQRFGIVGATIAAVGVILLIIAFTATDWYKGASSAEPAHFGNVHDALTIIDRLGVANGLAVAYFSWLAWVLLVLGAVVALLANLPSPLSGAMRALGALIGLIGAGLTVGAIKLTSDSTGSGLTATLRTGSAPSSYGDYITNANVAFWLAIAGFVIIAIGSLIGPRRSH